MIGRNLNLAFNLNVIYDNASFTIQDNDKVGIVPKNIAIQQAKTERKVLSASVR